MADIFQGRGVGTAAGIVNALGTAGAALFNLAVGPMLDSVGYVTVFLIAAFLHPTAALVLELTCLRRLRAEKRALREASA
jgi:ACS family hexuronate transporter-like MFS transporter